MKFQLLSCCLTSFHALYLLDAARLITYMLPIPLVRFVHFERFEEFFKDSQPKLPSVQKVSPNCESYNINLKMSLNCEKIEVFRVSCGEEKLLLRIYGSTEHGIFKRADEADVSFTLCFIDNFIKTS